MNTEISSQDYSSLTKESKYESVLSMLGGSFDGENDLVANLANAAALLKEVFGWWWVGFYLVKSNELVLGPFQGPVACTRIAKGRGVCGTCWQTGQTQVVPDVHAFPGHIACSANSNSEIVVPIQVNNQIVGVLDLDSEQFNGFDTTDAQELEKICALIAEMWERSVL